MAVRASLACFPSDPALHAACGMPWGVAITPFSATDERGFPPATGTEGHLLPRCQSCFAYFNLLCPLDRWSWNCAICGAENDLSADAAARYARDGGHDPPEMRSAFVDLLLPVEEGEAAAAAAPTPVYVAAIDLSSSEEFLELVKSALQAALEALLPGSLFGLLTFSSKIGLYDVQGPIPIVKNVFIPPDSDGALQVDLEDIMPLCSFLASIDSCKDRITEALETIKPMSSWEVAANAHDGQDHVLHHIRGFGVALDVLINYLSSEYGNAFELARIFAFLSGPPNYGAGQLDINEDQNSGKARGADHILLQEQTSFYRNLATSAVQAGVCVDLFAITNEYTDLTSLKVLSVESGGSLFLYSSTDESTLPQDIYKMLSRPYAFGCVMRLRTSSQFKIVDSYGHFFPDPQYMHVQHINCCDSFATYSYDFEFEKDSQFSRKSSPPIIQIAFKYTVLVHNGDISDLPNSGCSALEPASLRQAIWPTLISYSSPDVEAEVHQSLSRTVFTSERPIYILDAYKDLLVYYSPTASSEIPFPPPRNCLLRSTVDRLKQERNITPKLVFIHGAHDDTTEFEKYLVEDQTLDGSPLSSSTGFSSFLDEVRSKVAEHGI
ncbi:sec23/sec24 transport family protein [Zea mays]|uniref:Sec23/sec24 transport family protein n=1 Tax=Zea mays TaxID=4577 RepID=A0A1D6J6N1_MAIZE|nr:sec23/sec24 transport family protein [Zea mays]